MLMLSMLFVALGLGAAAYGIAAQRTQLAAETTAMTAGYHEADEAGNLLGSRHEEASGVYRAIEPALDAGADLLRRVSPAARIQLTRDRIVWAGLEGTLTVEKVLGYKAGATVAGLLLGFIGHPSAVPAVLWAVLFAAAASFVPDVVLSSRASARQTDIARALPESLDLLALTVEAGLGFEGALQVVVENTSGPLAGELTRLLREVELGVPRREALSALRDRTDVPDLSAFVVSLVQSEQMGISLGDVLKTQAAQVRLKRRQAAKEQAGKTPVKIMVPVVLGIFPSLFVVTVGPGAIEIANTLFKT